jgi:hypothetical protein
VAVENRLQLRPKPLLQLRELRAKRIDGRDLVSVLVRVLWSSVLGFERSEFAEEHLKRLVHRRSLRRIEAKVARESVAHRGTLRTIELHVFVTCRLLLLCFSRSPARFMAVVDIIVDISLREMHLTRSVRPTMDYRVRALE